MLELLVASTVMSIGLIAAARAFPMSYGTVKASGNLTEATALAQETMEQLRSTARANFNAVTSGTRRAPSATEGPYTITWTWAVTGAAPARYATVTVNVRWGGANPGSADFVSGIAQ